MLVRSSGVSSRPAIHSACLIISGVTAPAWAACAASAAAERGRADCEHGQALQKRPPLEYGTSFVRESVHGVVPFFHLGDPSTSSRTVSGCGHLGRDLLPRPIRS